MSRTRQGIARHRKLREAFYEMLLAGTLMQNGTSTVRERADSFASDADA